MFSTGNLNVLSSSTFREQRFQFAAWVQIVNNLVPFYAHFFKSYRLSQKLHVVHFLQNYKVYDDELFTNFVGAVVE